jgi:hypothetical protein
MVFFYALGIQSSLHAAHYLMFDLVQRLIHWWFNGTGSLQFWNEKNHCSTFSLAHGAKKSSPKAALVVGMTRLERATTRPPDVYSTN